MDWEALRLTPESELVVWCAALRASERETDRVRRLLARPPDWTTVLSLAQRHGVVPLLHDGLQRLPAGSVPARLTDVLARRAARHAERRDRLLVALRELLAACAARRIDVIPLRSARLPASPSELIEIDLLVRRHDVAATAEVLATCGLEPETPLTAEETFALLHADCARRFVHPGGYVVSLQWDVAGRAVVHGPSIEELWRRASPGVVAGRPCLTLAPGDLLQLLCVRGTLKRWHRLAWVREIADLIAGADPAELEEALARATKRGSRRALALGGSLAVRLLGASVPPRLMDAARDPAVSALGRGVVADLAAIPRPLPSPWRIARFQLQSRERVRDKIRYAMRRAVMPGPHDIAALRLPPRLFFLMYLLSPLLRARRAGALLARRFRRFRGQKIARFVRTPPRAVERMLALAGVTAADTVFDLGCGDGGILIQAARRIGCRGMGVELDETLLAAARVNARAAGVEGLVEFVHGDAREVDLAAPTVVSLYLNAAANLTLRPYLQRGLRDGARIVSFNFDMGDWWPEDLEILDETSWGSNTIYLWRISRPTPDGATGTAA